MGDRGRNSGGEGGPQAAQGRQAGTATETGERQCRKIRIEWKMLRMEGLEVLGSPAKMARD